MQVERLVFFSDAVVAITLLALAIKKQLDTTPQKAGQYVTVDLYLARYIDHTVMENLHNYECDFQLAGGEFNVINLNEHKPMSAHSMAARCKKLAI